MNKDWFLSKWKKMSLIREFDLQVKAFAETKEAFGYFHTSIGQEAISVGVIENLAPSDYLTSTYRNHSHGIARGLDVRKMWGELLGRETGYCRGLGGSMHIADQTQNFIGAMGIVAGGIPIAAGAAFAAKYQKTNQIAACFFGDGAIHQGAFHEGLEFAIKFEVPVLFICENNLYAESTATNYHLIHESVIDYVRPYGIQAHQVDGNDLELVESVSRAEIERVRHSGKPSFIEFMTYKMSGQYEGDKQTYKSRNEIEYWMSRDPLVLLSNVIKEKFKVPAEEFEAISSANKEFVEAAFILAQTDAYPTVELLRDAVYKEGTLN